MVKKSGNYSLMTGIMVWSAMTVMSSMYVTIPLISVFSQSFSVSESQAAWTSSIYSIFYALGALIYGPLSDKLGRKQVIVAGMLLLLLSSLLLGFTKTLTPLIILRAVHGAAAASFSPVALAYVTESFPQNKKVSAVGFISAGFLMASILGQVFGSFVYTHIGWNYIFTILAGIYVVTVVLVVLCIPGYPPRAAAGVDILKQAAEVLKKKQLMYAYVVAAVALLSIVGMYTALGSCLADRFGLDANQILYVRSAGIAGMLVSPFAGRLAKKFGLVPVLRYALILSIIGLIVLALGMNIIVMVAASVIFVAGIAIAIPALISLVGELGSAVRGMAISIYTFILFAGASVGPILATSLLATGSHTLTFLVMALCILIGVIATLLIKIPAAERQ